MDYTERERLVNQIASTRTIVVLANKKYFLKQPTAEIRYEADLAYLDALDDGKFEDFLNFPLNYLVNEGLLIANYEQSISELTKSITNLQVDLYKALVNPAIQKDIRKRLSLVRKKLNETVRAKHVLDDTTLEGYANLIRLQFLIFKITYRHGKRYWTSKSEVNYKLMENLIFNYVKSRIETSKIRELARTEPWHTIYNAGRPNPFGVKAKDLNENQRELLYYTELYENAGKSLEPPTEEIMNDDDVFDGWLTCTIQKMKEERQGRTQKNVLGGIHEKASEIFIPIQQRDSEGNIKTPEMIQQEIQAIDNLNDLSVKIMKDRRSVTIKAKGELAECELPDKQMELQSLLRENALKVKGK